MSELVIDPSELAPEELLNELNRTYELARKERAYLTKEDPVHAFVRTEAYNGPRLHALEAALQERIVACGKFIKDGVTHTLAPDAGVAICMETLECWVEDETRPGRAKPISIRLDTLEGFEPCDDGVLGKDAAAQRYTEDCA